MDSVNISQLKTYPAKIISQSDDYPIVVEKRNQVKAYLIGKDLFEKIVTYLEDSMDRKIIKETDFSKSKDFEKVAKRLGI